MQPRTSPSSEKFSNMETWNRISDILSSCKDETSFKPKSGDTLLLLPSTFANVVKKRHAALSQSLQYQVQTESLKNVEPATLSEQMVVDCLSALKQLQAHYELLLRNPTRVRAALTGFDEDGVVWVPPDAQQDFVSFVTALWTRWGTSNVPPKSMTNLVQWAMQPQIDHDLLQAGVESSACMYQTIEQAFKTFRLALDDMINLHEEHVNSEESC